MNKSAYYKFWRPSIETCVLEGEKFDGRTFYNDLHHDIDIGKSYEWLKEAYPELKWQTHIKVPSNTKYLICAERHGRNGKKCWITASWE